MFETAELGQAMSKDEYDAVVPKLRIELLAHQKKLGDERKGPILVLIHGVEGAGKGELLHTLHEWFDTRYLFTFAWDVPSEEEQQRPEYFRYWMALPPRGRIGLFIGSWYTRAIHERAHDRIDDATFDAWLARINAFEESLSDDGAHLIKLWLHISKKEQKKRLKKLASDPETSYRVGKRERKQHKLYKEFWQVAARAIRITGTGEAPWQLVESTDARFRDVTAARHVFDGVSKVLASPEPPPEARPPAIAPDPTTILDGLDLTRVVPKAEYDERLDSLQGKLGRLARELAHADRGLILVFEGWDAAGKGGCIRRMIRALDPRQYRALPISAPTDEELAHHYLWRFWRYLPRRGRITFYDRSWYGRVLVERVEGYARESEVLRAYKEINDFEEQLVGSGQVLVKFWLHISSDEQLRRFEARARDPWKKHKLSPDDYRNRNKRNLYEAAANDMIARTSTEFAAWTLVEAEDKRYGRIKVLETACERLEAELE